MTGRGRLHRVRAAEGPERIGEEWWRGPIEAVSVAKVRDYYRNGQLEAKGRLDRNFRVGKWKHYFESGKTVTVTNRVFLYTNIRV